MLEYKVSEIASLKCIELIGRIDGVTADDAEKIIDAYAIEGERIIIIDFNGVNYISSVGLRVFLKIQKELKKVSGELILLGMTENIFQIFKSSGFHKIFSIFNTKDDILQAGIGKEEISETITKVVNNILIQYIKYNNPKIKLNILGSSQKTSTSDFSVEDVITVKPEKRLYGTGLSSIGINYEDYKNFFGESIIINGSLFFYPAIHQPAVDFMLFNEADNQTDYKFFHGFSFCGKPKYMLSFEGVESNVQLSSLVNAASKIFNLDLFGIVIFTESKGLWGMNLKKIPIIENKPTDNSEIFSNENFSNWMDFPVEPDDFNSIVIANGLVVNDRTQYSDEIRNLFSKDYNYHIHSAIFENTLTNKTFENFEEEMNRIVMEQEAIKVQHLLGQSMFGKGIAAIYELE